jgi:L-lactate transport
MSTLLCAALCVWPQPLDPLHWLPASALVATIPLLVVLLLMGVLRKSSLQASACGLLTAVLLAALVWHMPLSLASWSLLYGFAFAAWSILWLVFNALWLYNLTIDVGLFELLRRWIHYRASGDPCVQATLVAFCFGALLEGNAGFGAPVAITSCLLVALGFRPRMAVLASLLANTVPVAFGAVGIPIVALAGVTGLDVMKLSIAIGRQLPLVSVVLPAYLILLVGGFAGLKRSWPVALVAGCSFAATQFVVSNFWGPYATDVASSLVSIVATVLLLRVWSPKTREPAPSPTVAVASESKFNAPAPTPMTLREVLAGWLPWALLSVVIVLWSNFRLPAIGQLLVPIPSLHHGVLITLYHQPYSAIFAFQPLTSGTAVLVTTLLTALLFRVSPSTTLLSAGKTLRQLRVPGLAVLFIVGLAYLYNYSGMAYTLGAALALVGPAFPFVSSFLGWVACFLSGSDTSSNVLFGNLQVAAAHQLQLNPVLMAATNSSGAVMGKMISPQNIAVGVTTVGLVGEEGKVLHSSFWHSVLLAALIGLIACLQAYVVTGMIPR